MNSQEKYNLIGTAYTTKEVADDRKEITIINDELPAEMRQAIKDIQFTLNEETGTFELDYEIMADACRCVSDIALADLKDTDFYETECASVYTTERLSYLNANNDTDIAEIMKEYGLEDISTACAIWYNKQVARACEMIRDYIYAV